MAGNLLGQGFDEYVVKQINKRQEIYGSVNRTNEIIQFINNKTAFLRLSSGTQVDKLINGLKIENKDFVLFNGISSLKGNSFTQKSGITRTNSQTIDTNHAYGFGGLDYGQSPMPGLISADIKSLNRGALREGDIVIKAFNTVQFDIIDALYLRLGHYIFLEWGWSSYYDNNGVFRQDTSYYELCQKFMGAKLTVDEILKEIEKQRESSGGNYDGFLARIVNFSWSRDNDGTYNISLKVRGVGDVIESLKINVLNPDSQSELQNQENKKDKDERTDPPQTYPEDASSKEIIRSAARKSSIGNYFYGIYKNLSPQGNNISTYSDPKLATNTNDFALVNYNYPGWFDGDNRELYIRLGSLFQWMENNIMLAFKDKNKKISKALSFDKDTEKNLIYIDYLQIPVDPRVCIFNKTVTLNDPGGTSRKVELFPGIDTFISEKSFNKNQYGQIMNIYVNCGFILKKLDEVKDKEGNTALISFLNSILSDINNAIGGNNKLEATIDPTTDNKVIIIDNNQLPDRDDILKSFGLETELAKFEVYGYVNRDNISKAGFVKGFEFKTEITPQMSTMITIGGTSNGNTQHQDSTALSAINSGTVNLYAEEALDNETTVSEDTTDSKPKPLEETYKDTIKAFVEFVEGLAEEEPSYDPEDIDSYKSALQQMLQYKEAKANQSKPTDDKKTGSRNIGFIPFNLTLKIEGLSGIKIYQKYITDGSFLPSSYPNSLDFLTKGVNHNISSNVWETTLESLAVPKNSSTPDDIVSSSSSAEKSSSRGTVNVGGTASRGVTSFVCPVKSIIEPPPPLQPTSPIRSRALSVGYKYTFYNDGKSNQPQSHLCSKYTYTHAFNYVKSLRNQSKELKSGGQIAAGGNANQSSYWSNLVKLGYTQTKIGTGISKNEIINLINKTTYNYGDVIVYWATDNPTDSGASQYGHTQIYIGNTISGVTWASDRYTNYNNSSFVYNKSNYTCWNLIIFRAPIA
jgi:hypothetical protein